MVVVWPDSVNDERPYLFHDNLGSHVMARQVADVVKRAGGLWGEPQLDPPMGRNQDADKPCLVELGRAVPAYLDVGAVQEQQRDEGVQVFIVVADDQSGRFALLHSQGFRGERPLAGYNLN